MKKDWGIYIVLYCTRNLYVKSDVSSSMQGNKFSFHFQKCNFYQKRQKIIFGNQFRAGKKHTKQNVGKRFVILMKIDIERSSSRIV